MGIGRCLRIAAAGDEHLLNVRMDDIALPLAPRGLAQLSANHPTQLPAGLSGNKVPWTRYRCLLGASNGFITRVMVPGGSSP